MVTKFEKSMYQNLLIIEDIPENINKFQEEMLLNNTIEGFLSFSIRYIDNERKYYYTVTGMQSIQAVYEKVSPSRQIFKNLFEQILRYIKIINNYLLEADDIVLDPNFIFMQAESMQVALCCCPGYGKDIVGQMSKLLEYFMNHIEYSDKDAVMLVYAIYMNSRDVNMNIDRLYQILIREEDKYTASAQKEVSASVKDDTGSAQTEIMKPAGVGKKYSREVEVLYHPMRSYIISTISHLVSLLFLLILFQSGFMHKELGNRLNQEKTIFILLIFLLIHAATLYIAFYKDPKHSRIEDKPVYLYPDAVDYIKEERRTSVFVDTSNAEEDKFQR